jgi:phosphoenolpyruvate phosphomutase
MLVDIGSHLPLDRVHGEWIGLLKASSRGAAAIRGALEQLGQRDDFRKLRLDDLFRHLLAGGQAIRVLFITGHWLDVDTLDDLSAANAF